MGSVRVRSVDCTVHARSAIPTPIEDAPTAPGTVAARDLKLEVTPKRLQAALTDWLSDDAEGCIRSELLAESGVLTRDEQSTSKLPDLVETDVIDLNTFKSTPLDVAVKDLYAQRGMVPPGGPSERGWTVFSTFMTCPYKFKLRYRVGAPVEGSEAPTVALEVGGLWHLLTANEYLAQLEEPAMEQGFLVDGLLARGVSAQVISEAQRLHAGYQNYYENDYLTPLAVELIPTSDLMATCRYDLIARAEGSQTVPDGVWIVEHKTASRLDRSTQEGWKNDGQILIQIAAWKRAKLDKKFGRLAGVIVNLVVKTKLPQFVRIVLPVNAKQVRAHLADLDAWDVLQRLCEVTGTWPRNRASCVGRYGLCEFFSHCAGDA